jgi:hypothetical protein
VRLQFFLGLFRTATMLTWTSRDDEADGGHVVNFSDQRHGKSGFLFIDRHFT